jgi:YHS domain-containing protein
MSAFISSMASGGPPGIAAVSADSSVDELVKRLSAEVTSAAERIRELQTEAGKEFLGQEKRALVFVPLADHIQAILQLRLDAFMDVDVFKDIQQTVSLEKQGADGRGFHGRMTRLVVPFSDRCPANVELSFHLGHDGPVENAFLDYKLDIVPIFIKFDSHDQLVIPIANPNDAAIGAWIDDKLVEFTRTYFKLYFTDQYQKQNMETDPVMSIRFPRAYAAANKEYQGRTYHFYTTESFDEFERNPSQYVSAP